MRFVTTTALAALSVGLLTAPEARAQETSANASTAADIDEDEILITARRREERLQEVPVAVSAFSNQQLEEANVTRLENLGNIAPSLQITHTAGRANIPGFAIRGQRQDSGFITNDPSIGIYVAEAVQARVFGLAQSLFDLESIQVLRGPQGTLFGRNTTGGAILIQPRRPDLGEVNGYALVRVGNFDRFDLQGAINLPLHDTLALRVAYNRTRRDGWVTNVVTGQRLNEEHTDSARAILLFEPSDTFRSTTYFDYFEADAAGTAARLILVNPTGLAQTRFNLGAVLARQDQELSFYETEGNLELRSAGSNLGATNVTEGDITEHLTLRNIMNFRRIKSVEDQDQDSTIHPVLSTEDDQEVTQLTEEIQLQGTTPGGRLNYIVGGYYFAEDGFRETLTTALGAVPSPRRGDSSNTSLSVYAQGDYDITDALTLTLGGRYTWDHREFRQQLRSGTTGACVFCASTSASFSAPTYTATLSWQIDPDKLLYVAHRRGYRAGGHNSSANNAGSLTPFDSEFVSDAEVGFKADWELGTMRLRTNLAAYRTWYDDIQRTIIIPINNVPITSIFNAASATIDGVEAEVEFKPNRFVDLLASMSWVDPRYTEFQYTDPSGKVVDQSANEFSYIPEWTYRLGARAHVPVGGSGMELAGSVDWYWQSEIFFAEFNSAINRLPGWGLLSGRLALNNIAGRVDVALWGRNLTGEKFFQSGSDQFSGLGIVYHQYGEPRTYGVEATIRF